MYNFLMILTVKVMAYTVLAYSYQVRLYDAFQFTANAYYQYRLQLPYKDCRICLINHMRFISHHITLLVDRLGVVLRGQTAIFTQGHYHFQYKRPAHKGSDTLPLALVVFTPHLTVERC